MARKKLLKGLLFIGCYLALTVIALGAYTRLTDAGLGCPDWPGCYGHISVPAASAMIPVVAKKAWAEMIHRYFAGTLALLIFATILIGFRTARAPFAVLFLLLLYQPILGMWTVTWKLAPFIVTQHLLGGMAILALLFLSYLIVKCKAQPQNKLNYSKQEFFFIVCGIVLLYLQIALGAWTSTNYAAISCSDFPFCQLTSWHYDFYHAFKIIRPIGPNYDGGLLSFAAKRTIQMMHRFGALVVSLYWFTLSILLIIKKYDDAASVNTSKLIFWVIGLLLLQVCLGIANVLLARPLIIAVMHNVTAALLLISTIRLAFYSYKGFAPGVSLK